MSESRAGAEGAPSGGTRVREAVEADVALILRLIREIAEYERLSHEVVATEELLRASLFGENRVAEALIAELDGEPAGIALFFHSFSTFLGRPGIYLKDLYVMPPLSRRGFGALRRGLHRFRTWRASSVARAWLHISPPGAAVHVVQTPFGRA